MVSIDWVDRGAYPFVARHFEIDGASMHYVDEGEGRPIVMVHGTPVWSLVYRDLIRSLRPRFRCIAPDQLGFGLSDKPDDAASRPADHARRLGALIEHLDLRNLTLVGHDFGGPIGLSYAITRPENVHSLVLFNTWMWSLAREPIPHLASRLGGSALGRFLFRRFNIETRLVFKAVWGDRSKLSAALHQQYIRPLPFPGDRQAMWVLARELLASGAWFDELWRRRERIQDIPALLLWGLTSVPTGKHWWRRSSNIPSW